MFRGGGGILKRLLCASLLGLTILGANAAEFIQTPTLGEDSAYTLTEASEAGADSLTLYELKDKTGSYSYVDKNGEAVTKTYTTVEALPHYYDMTITANSAERIENSDTIGDIVDHFIGQSSTSSGGAISNSSTIGNITGDFINNVTTANFGGAIYNNRGTIGDITGDFINNSVMASGGGGGAISSFYGEIGSISGNFINNYSESYGGAIFELSDKIIDHITGNFIGNVANHTGGAIYSYNGGINSITGNFINNTAAVDGGAINICSNATVSSINGNFINNSAEFGGAIANMNEIKNITGYFYGNHVLGDGDGGAIINSGLIDTITGIFINNSSEDGGGVLYNYARNTVVGKGLVKSISGDFISNSAKYGGVILNVLGGTIGKLSGNFIENSTSRQGGVIYNENGTIENLSGNFIQNSAGTGGGAIENTSGAELIALSGNFIENSAGRYGGAIANMSNAKIVNIANSLFLKNNAVNESENTYGGGIFNNDATIGNIVNSDFIGNSAVSAAGEALGGAIYSDGGSIALTAKDGYTSTFKDNYTESAGERKNNAIYLTGDAVMDFKMENGGKFLMADGIGGTDYKLSITGDDISKTRFYLYNTINSGDVTLSNTTIDMVNRQIAVNTVNNLTIGSDTNLAADVDLANKTMDRFTSPAYGTHSGNLTVSSVNLLSDGKENVTAVLFADEGLKDNAGTTVKTAYTPIYKYDVSYDNRDDAGYMLFTRGGAGSNSPDSYNPAVLNGAVSTIAAGQATINETFKYVFEHADAFTQLPAVERMAQIKNDYYALSTDYNTNLDGLGGLNGGLAPEFHNDGAWVRPYVTFESMNLKNGPDVDAITYGTLIGFDSDFEDFGHGWTGVTTGYVGYNGSQLSYSGNDTSMNGGLLGVTQTFYKGDFWTAITASAGASVGETSTMYGSEDFTSLLAGIGSKTGYNFEFKEGKYILQPIMFLSYTFVNTFDYTNAAGVKIESDPLHTIQLNPSVRFIANLKNGWQPYASVGMVWNLLNQTDTTANGVSLPDMHVKPYVEYGLGVQKRWADKFTAFFQTMIRNGGRNGVALTGGFRWNLGKDPDETVNTENKVKKVIKSLNSRVAGK